MAEHYPVMKDYVVQYLNFKDGGIYIDATCGYGGHSRYILERNSNIFLYGLDKDEDAIRYISRALAGLKNFKAIHSG